MFRNGELVYGLVVAVDIENFSGLDTLTQSTVQARLSRVLDLAASRAYLDRTKWHRQLRGDGELAVLPPDTDVAWVAADFPHQIAEELKDRGHPRLRLRIAMHHGTLTAGDFGPVGNAPIVACRLLDARATRRALATETDSDVVVVVSQQLFRDVVGTRFHGLRPERFRPMHVSIKGATYTGYLCVGSPRGLASDPVVRARRAARGASSR
jgi:hypothetical protein